MSHPASLGTSPQSAPSPDCSTEILSMERSQPPSPQLPHGFNASGSERDTPNGEHGPLVKMESCSSDNDGADSEAEKPNINRSSPNVSAWHAQSSQPRSWAGKAVGSSLKIGSNDGAEGREIEAEKPNIDRSSPGLSSRHAQSRQPDSWAGEAIGSSLEMERSDGAEERDSEAVKPNVDRFSPDLSSRHTQSSQPRSWAGKAVGSSLEMGKPPIAQTAQLTSGAPPLISEEQFAAIVPSRAERAAFKRQHGCTDSSASEASDSTSRKFS